ncbi:MAG TPA: TolC family protein [Polyangiaceae bacterium]|nr:TolC family protein [Polyangiaceae bacterium]
MSNQSPALIAVAVCLVLARPAFGQDKTGDLTSQNAVEIAIKNNPSLHIALLQQEQARYAVVAEEALYDPLFNANASLAHNGSPTLRGTTGTVVSVSDIAVLGAGLSKSFSTGTTVGASVTGQRRVTRSPPINNQGGENATGPSYALIGTLTLSQAFLRGAGNTVGLASLRLARFNRTAATLATLQSGSQILHDVLTDYWELWYSTEASKIIEASRDLAKVLEEQAKEQVKSGTLANVDALPFATQVAEQEESMVQQATDRRQRALALAQAIGQAGRVGPDLRSVDTPPDVDVNDGNADAVDDALATSYVLKQLQSELESAQYQAKIAGDALRPALNLDASLSAQGLGNRAVAPAFEQFGTLDAVSAQVALTFQTPVTSTRRNAQIQNALLSAHITEKQIESARAQLRTDVQSALARRNAAKNRFELARATEKVAGQLADGQRGRFLAGTALAIEVQKADDSHRQAQLRVQRARVDLVEGELDLLHLRGKLLERYADVLKRLTPNVLTLDDAREPM